ncbi:MAG: rod-binding protein [Mariprofundaceae bacterium]|nr:rod-binding protein [Mariprofundaceae bacterium]
MRDLVETVIAQVLQQDKRAAKPAADPEAFKSEFVKALNNKPIVHADAVDMRNIKNKELWDVSVKFEAVFFQQMMSAMRKTVPDSGFLAHGFAQDVQESMFDQAVADAGSKSGGLGIALSIYRQLERNDTSNKHDANKAIQEMKQASDRQDVSMYAELRGDVDGTH